VIYDCFPFFNELDLLEIRLNELGPYVDKFVLCESTQTFRKKPKPLYFERNKERFAPFLDKIIHLVFDDAAIQNMPPEKHGQWAVEHNQREHLKTALTKCSDDDVIMLSDADEIIRPSRLEEYLNRRDKNREIWSCRMRMLMYALNGHFSHRIPGTVIFTYRWFRDERKLSMRDTRKSRRHGNMLPSSGWHFHASGGIEDVREKLTVTSHSERDNDSIRQALEERIRKGIFYVGDNGVRVQYVPIDETFPKYLRENQEKFRHLIREPS